MPSGRHHRVNGMKQGVQLVCKVTILARRGRWLRQWIKNLEQIRVCQLASEVMQFFTSFVRRFCGSRFRWANQAIREDEVLDPIGSSPNNYRDLVVLVNLINLLHSRKWAIEWEHQRMKRKFTHKLDGILYPLPNHILFPWFLDIHQKMFDPFSLLHRYFVRDDVKTFIDLHRISVDDFGTGPAIHRPSLLEP